ncbi:putative two-component response regulator [Gordonia amicalis NBRC 100051 = JCM 11271]|nr:putative two-component response regulator [Gordonia amicalis NBRC 100051 = JCM 11271]
MTARIMIVNDDPLVRSGLRLLLGGDPGLDIVAEAANGQEALDSTEMARLIWC